MNHAQLVLHKGIETRDLMMLERSLRVGATADAEALCAAAASGWLLGVKVLLDHGAALEESGRESAFNAACRGGNAEVLRLLVARGARPAPRDGFTEREDPVWLAAACGAEPELLSELFQLGCRPEAVGRDGSSALLAAAAQGHAEVVKVLLTVGCDPNKATKGEIRPIHAAAARGHAAALQALIDGGAWVDEPVGQPPRTALELAIAGRHAAAVEVLKRAGAWR